MGGQQSKVTIESLPNEKLIIEQLKALQVRQRVSEDDEYVCIESNEKQKQKYVSKSSSLSITTIETWEHELLQDPKNRSVVHFSAYISVPS
jgi:bleomycin hydrolase